jgi:pimeloyl-ACP methyl ester carboxylesterase
MEGGDTRVVETGGASLVCHRFGDGPAVLLAHGFPDCARSFRHQVPALVAAGFSAIVPSLRGYAPSSPAHDGRYDVGALAADLVAVARALGGGAPVRLVGHDWGAIAGYAAGALAPELFSHLVTVAVPHLSTIGPRFLAPAQLRRSWYIGLFQLPWLPERRLAAGDFALVDRLWRDWSPGYVLPPEERAAIHDGLRGREADVLGYYRALGRIRGHERRLLLAKTRQPALYIHGRDDGCIGVALTEGCERGYAGPIAVHRLAGGHFVHMENSDRFNDVLMPFLKQPM